MYEIDGNKLMENLDKKLKQYDKQYVANVSKSTGYCMSYVREVLKGDRRNEQIINTAKVLLKKYKRKNTNIFNDETKH